MKTIPAFLLLIQFTAGLAIEPVLRTVTEKAQYLRHFGESFVDNSSVYSIVGTDSKPTKIEILDIESGMPPSIVEMVSDGDTFDAAVPEGAKLHSFFKFSGGVYLAYTQTENKVTTLYAVAIDEYGEAISAEQKLHSMEHKAYSKSIFFKIETSIDHSKLVVAAINDKYGSSANTDLQLRMHSFGFDSPAEFAVEPIKYQSSIKTASIRMKITNTGNVALFAKFDTKDHRNDYDDIIMTVINFKKGKQYNLNPEEDEYDVLYEKLELLYNPEEDSFVFTGFCSTPPKGRRTSDFYTGVITVTTHSEGKNHPEVAISFFSPKMLANFYKLPVKNLKPEVGLSKKCEIKTVHITPDGTMYLLFEYNKNYHSIEGEFHYVSDYIGIIRFDSNRQLSRLQRIYKRQEVFEFQNTDYLSFAPIFHNNDIYLIYNDNKKNIAPCNWHEKCQYMLSPYPSALVSVKIDASGKMHKTVLQDNEKMGSALWIDKTMRVADNTLSIPLIAKNTDINQIQSGAISVKHVTIKLEEIVALASERHIEIDNFKTKHGPISYTKAKPLELENDKLAIEARNETSITSSNNEVIETTDEETAISEENTQRIDKLHSENKTTALSIDTLAVVEKTEELGGKNKQPIANELNEKDTIGIEQGSMAIADKEIRAPDINRKLKIKALSKKHIAPNKQESLPASKEEIAMDEGNSTPITEQLSNKDTFEIKNDNISLIEVEISVLDENNQSSTPEFKNNKIVLINQDSITLNDAKIAVLEENGRLFAKKLDGKDTLMVLQDSITWKDAKVIKHFENLHHFNKTDIKDSLHIEESSISRPKTNLK